MRGIVNRLSDPELSDLPEDAGSGEALTVERFKEIAWEQFGFVVGNHPMMRKNLENIAAFARYLRHGTRPTVVITGPTGSGKGPMARVIHHVTRPKETIDEINCATVTESLAESRLFGHIKGAFTDAYKDRVGAFEKAGHGTVVLDEITKLTLGNQAKLLHVLEEGRFYRVGDETARESHAMVIASGSEDLSHAVRRGTFLDELYQRLGVLKLRLPALRDRLEDLPVIASGLVQTQVNEVGADGIWTLENEALERLREESWPGNIRQLRKVIRRALVFATGTAAPPGTITREHITASLAMDEGEEVFPLESTTGEEQVVFQDDGITIHRLDVENGSASLTVKLGDGSTTSERVEAALVKALNEGHLSQARLARLLGRSRTHVSKWMQE